MMLFVSGATATMRRHRRHVGELIVPGAGSAPDALALIPGRWAMDNGAFTGFDVAGFMDMLQRFHGRLGCRFVAAPDVVGDAPATLARWPFWSAVIRGAGFVPALVAQDGLTVAETPWPELGALFIGGHTEWKLGPHAAELIAYANARGLWVHVGRVNSRVRIWHFARAGADSFDGGKYSRFPDTWIPDGIADAHAAAAQGILL